MSSFTMKFYLLVAIVCVVCSSRQTEAMSFRKLGREGACGVDATSIGELEVQPTHYSLDLELNLNKPKFGGQVDIDVDIVAMKGKRANQIWLNAHESIDIRSIQYKTIPTGSKLTTLLKSSKVIEVLDACLNTKHQVLVLTLVDDLDLGSKGKLSISYEGQFGEFGLRKKSYEFHTDESEPDVMFALKSNNVRRLLPCFDNNSSPYVSTFKLTVKRFPHLKAISNTDLDYDLVDREDQSKVISFLQTQPIRLDELKLEMRA